MKVSVIIPVYNAEKFIEKAVASALEQPETAEVVLAEDGSTDNSLAICKRLSKENPKVKLYQHPNAENRGTPATRNLGIQKATGDYIALLDNDDFFLPGRFAKAKELFRQDPSIDGVYEAIGTFAYDDESLEKHIQRMKAAKKDDSDLMLTTISRPVLPEELFRTVLLQHYGWLHVNGLTLKRSSVNKIGGFDEVLKWCEDTDFIYRLTYFCKLVPGRLNEPVAMRGVYKGNRTLSEEGMKNSHYYHGLLFRKMFHFMLDHKLDTDINRAVLKRYLDYYDPKFVRTPAGMRRKALKLKNLTSILLRHPSTIKRII